MKWHSV